MKIYKSLQFFLNSLGEFRNNAFWLLVIIIIVSVTESAGLWMILPFLELAINPEIKSDSFPILTQLLERFDEKNYLIVVSLTLFFVVIVKSLFALMQNYYMMKFVTDLRRYWESGVLDNYLHCKFDVLIRKKHGALLNNILNEPVLAAKAIREGVEFISKVMLSSLIFLVVLSVDWKITLSLLFVITIFLGVTWKAIGKYSVSVGKKKIKINQGVNSLASEFLHGIRQIKIFSAENKAVSEFTRKLNALFKMLIAFAVISKLPKIIGELIMFAIVISVVLYNQYVGDSNLTSILPILGFFLISFQKLFVNLSTLVSQRMSILSYLPSLRLVHQTVNNKELLENNVGSTAPLVIQDGLTFDQVTFRHGKKKVLNELSFEIKKGELTALVGTSGSGKSTVCDLISRFYLPTSGRLLIDGTDINNYSLKSWRNSIGYISQDTFLFDGSIRDNVLVGKRDASDDDVKVALSQACALDFTQNMTDSFNTSLGNSGANISGGQRQRIAIARAIIRSTDLLILDEPTSSLDAETEKQIISFLENYKTQKAILVITHNVSTLKNFDQIFVIDKGQIVESGCYNELIIKNRLFAKLAESGLDDNIMV